jgi:hypothetical protein
MYSLRISPKINILVTLLLLSSTAVAQNRIPATGLCNTGLTPASPLPTGCTTSTPVTPVNPESGGPSVDGNWQLATPYPSARYNQEAPNPCSLTTFGPAWVDAPWSSWFNPNDGLSQWITPQVEGPVAAGGWYIYRTAIPIPIASGSNKYALTVTGQLLADNTNVAIFLSKAPGHDVCRPLTLMGGSQSSMWNPFKLKATITSDSDVHLYFVVYNYVQDYLNPTGLRVEFTSAYFTPE